ncbi:energy transducer TonB [Croceicoccus naphthovorans]|uniref:TonB C-terminal domain-containing protein n=1 Tax=Croceicoccus naphthovorans TaxID=1348774 RepID=A0A0G3XEH7_9SPHN|nr:energy transducer TonB [Croceicoccus naphthovorans]AKM09577.1 hypothetical protein AB433_05655 [Croceicoccus naphthovorans]MBB3989654.1 protein TonB [Croceicoccus naphthovorans]
MAYTDTRHDPNRAATLATVALIHAGLGYAIVSGFAGGAMTEAGKTIKSIFVEEEKVEIIPLDPPPPSPDAKPTESKVDPVIDPVITPFEKPDAYVINDPVLPKTKPSYETTIIELPAGPSTTPMFDPVGPTPRGNPGDWVSERDYPSRAIRNEIEGTTGFRLSIDAKGRVSDCIVVMPSGSSDLDEATCRVMSKRGKFNPAKNGNGDAVAGNYTSRITWRLPE